MVFDLAGVGQLETNLPTAGTWHHVAATYDGNTMKMFVDGWLAGSLAATGRIGITTDRNVPGQEQDRHSERRLFQGNP
jgi:hypothetical protein